MILKTYVRLWMAGLLVLAAAFALAGCPDTDPARASQPCDRPGAAVEDARGDTLVCTRRPGGATWEVRR